jgi:hypothetical protein
VSDNEPAEPIESRYDLAEMRAKWERYGAMLTEPEGEGSMLGRTFIIARSGVTDMLALLDLLEGALESTDD